MKRLSALLLALALLAGCSALPWRGGSATPAPAAELPPAAAAAPHTLAIDPGATPVLRRLADDYATAAGVSLGEASPGALMLLDTVPADPAVCRDLGADPLLAAAAARAGAADQAPLTALPLGRCLYAYWADSAVLDALLGGDWQSDLTAASWAEWSALAEALSVWLGDPAAAPALTLNGHSYTLPAERPAAAAALTGVFAPAPADAPLYTPALLAAGETRSEETLYSALNGLCSVLLLEADHRAGGDLNDGQAVFARQPLVQLAATLPAETVQRLVPLPIKSDLVESDLFSSEYNLTGLMDYPILTDAGWLAVPAGADEEQAAAAADALLWLYGSAAGEDTLTDTLLLITPWGTATGGGGLGQRQNQLVSSGILPAVTLDAATLAALDGAVQALWADPERQERQARTAFLEAAIAALAA